jgi:hypothetical protein
LQRGELQAVCIAYPRASKSAEFFSSTAIHKVRIPTSSARIRPENAQPIRAEFDEEIAYDRLRAGKSFSAKKS